MGSTDRPGRAEHPEHSDRPTTVADQTDRYEHRVAEHYSQPANRDKLDPFTHMTSGEIKRLYLPDKTPVLPEGTLRVDPSKTNHPTRPDGMPYAVIEGDRARLIDSARETPQTPERANTQPRSDRPDEPEPRRPGKESSADETDEPTGPETTERVEPEVIRRIRAAHGDRDAGPYEPTGEDLLEIESDERSRLDQFKDRGHQTLGEVAEDIRDGINSTVKALRSPEASGSHTETRAPHFTETQRHDADVGSSVTGMLVLGMLVVEAARAGMRHLPTREKGDERADQR